MSNVETDHKQTHLILRWISHYSKSDRLMSHCSNNPITNTLKWEGSAPSLCWDVVDGEREDGGGGDGGRGEGRGGVAGGGGGREGVHSCFAWL